MSIAHMLNKEEIRDAISKLKEIKGDHTILQPASRYKRPLELAIVSLNEIAIEQMAKETEVKKMSVGEAMEVIRGNYPISGRERLKEALDVVISEIEDNQWVKVEEELPGETTDVIISVKDESGDRPYEYTTVGWRYGDVWIVDNDIRRDVVAWKKMPKPYR